MTQLFNVTSQHDRSTENFQIYSKGSCSLPRGPLDISELLVASIRCAIAIRLDDSAWEHSTREDKDLHLESEMQDMLKHHNLHKLGLK